MVKAERNIFSDEFVRTFYIVKLRASLYSVQAFGIKS